MARFAGAWEQKPSRPAVFRNRKAAHAPCTCRMKDYLTLSIVIWTLYFTKDCFTIPDDRNGIHDSDGISGYRALAYSSDDVLY